MKTLQNDFTTPEQSKRLLELGVPAWTANLYFYEEGCINNNDEPSGVIPYGEVYEDNSKETMFSSYVELPSWSVGRLIEIFCICTDGRLSIEYLNGMQQTIIEKTIEAINRSKVDFSKLEE